MKQHVTKLVVCDPRRNALLQDGNQIDRADARKLSDLLYLNKLTCGGEMIFSDCGLLRSLVTNQNVH